RDLRRSLQDARPIFNDAAATLKQRGADYDGKGYQGGERSMEATVAIFKAWTGVELSEQDGWRFMIALKMARSMTGKPKLDTYVRSEEHTSELQSREK